MYSGNVSYYYGIGLEPASNDGANIYDIIAKMSDLAGIYGSVSWKFYYDPNAPVLLDIMPETGSFIANVSPKIIVVFSKKIKSINAFVDNNGTTHDYVMTKNSGNQTFEFRNIAMGDALKGEAMIRINLVDAANNSASYSSNFYVDDDYPSIMLNKVALTNESRLTISGSYGDMYVQKIELVNPVSRTISFGIGADDVGSFIFDNVALQANANNLIKVRITDKVGRTSEDAFNILHDSIPPSLSLQVASMTKNVNVPISGSTDGTTAKLFVDGNYVKNIEIIDNAFSDYASLQQDGIHIIQVVAYDAAGNMRKESRTIKLDTTLPSVESVDPASGQIRREIATVVANALDETGGSGINLSNSRIELWKDWAGNNSGRGSGTQIAGTMSNNGISRITFTPSALLSDGEYTAIVVPIDVAGNIGNAVMSTFKIDSNVPRIIIDQPSETLLYTNSPALTFAGRMEASAGKTLVERKVSHNLNPIDVPDVFSIMLSLTEGDNSIVASAKDDTGLSASVSRIVKLDTILPTISILNRETIISAGEIAIYGSFNDNNPILTSATAIAIRNERNGQAVSASMSADKSYRANVSLVEGNNDITATIIDRAGNINQASFGIIRDTSTPVIQILSPAPLPYLTGLDRITVSGRTISSYIEGTVVSIKVNEGAAKTFTVGPTGDFSFSNVLLASGNNTIDLAALNTAGMAGSISFIAFSDRTAPAITVSKPEAYPAGSYNAYTSLQENIPFEISTDENALCTLRQKPLGSEMQESLAGGTSHMFIYPFFLAANSAYNFNITCTDNVGNRKEITLKLNVDTNKPTVTNAYADPNPVMQYTEPLTTLTATASEMARCRYLFNTTPGIEPINDARRKEEAYGKGLPFFSDDKYAVTHIRPFNVEDFPSALNGNYGFYILCKDIAGSITSNVGKIQLGVNINWPLLILTKGPGGQINKHDVTIHATTNMNATCQALTSTNEVLVLFNKFLGLGQRIEGSYNHSLLLTGLDEGHHDYTISCEAVDSPGKTATEILSFDIDSLTPAPIITSPTPDKVVASEALLVEGIVEANATVNIYRDSQFVAQTHASGTAFSATIMLPDPGRHTIRVEAIDIAGNRNSASVNVVFSSFGPFVAYVSPEPDSVNGFTVESIMAIVLTDFDIGVNFANSTIELSNSAGLIQNAGLMSNDGMSMMALTLRPELSPLPEGNYSVKISAYDVMGRNVAYVYSFAVDLSGPRIQLISPAPNSVVNKPNVYVAGVITANSKITSASVTMNNQTALSILNPSNTGKMNFNVSRTLSEGNNIFTIKATSELGTSETSKSYSIVLDTIGPIGRLPASTTTSDPRPIISVPFDEITTLKNVSLMRLPSGPYASLSLISQSPDGTFYSFMPIAELTEGKYRFEMLAADYLGNLGKTTQDITLNFSFVPVLVSPPYGRSRTSVFDIVFSTSQNASCRYGFITTRPYSAYAAFNETGFGIHRLINFSLTDGQYNGVFYLFCNTSRGKLIGWPNGEYRYSFVVDTTPPVITNLEAVPNPVAECVFRNSTCLLYSTLMVDVSEPARCRHDDFYQEFDQMRYSFGSQNVNAASAYATSHKANLSFEQEGNYKYYVACEDQSWPPYQTETKEIEIRVDTGLVLSVLSTGPSGYVSSASVPLSAETNKMSNCRFYDINMTLLGTSLGKTKHTVMASSTKWNATVDVQVICNTSAETASGMISFFMDRTAPVFSYVNDSSPYRDPQKTNSAKELRVKFLAIDLESGIRSYEYRVENSRGNAETTWFNTTSSGDWITVENLNLTNGTYKFKVNATNKAGLSQLATTDGITVDTSFPVNLSPTCIDKIRNQGETGIDCGGPCTSKCALGQECLSNGDCTSGTCNVSSSMPICISNPCQNNVADSWNSETDVDCGGNCVTSYNKTCTLTRKCRTDADCTSNYCNPSRTCSTPSCADNIENGDETDTDCGGNCDKCLLDQDCDSNKDCDSGYCSNSRTCKREPPDVETGEGSSSGAGTIGELDKDTDGDGIPDWYEIEHGLNPNVRDSDRFVEGTEKSWMDKYLEDIVEGTEGEQPPIILPPDTEKGGFSLLTLILMIIILGLLAGGGYYVYIKYYKKKEAPIRPGMRLPGQPPTGAGIGTGRPGTGMGRQMPGRPGMMARPKPLSPQVAAAIRKRREERLKKHTGVFQKFGGEQREKLRQIDEPPKQPGVSKEAAGLAGPEQTTAPPKEEWINLEDLLPGQIGKKITKAGKDIFDQLADIAGVKRRQDDKEESEKEEGKEEPKNEALGKEAGKEETPKASAPELNTEKQNKQMSENKEDNERPSSETKEIKVSGGIGPKLDAPPEAENAKKKDDIFEELRRTASKKKKR